MKPKRHLYADTALCDTRGDILITEHPGEVTCTKCLRRWTRHKLQAGLRLWRRRRRP